MGKSFEKICDECGVLLRITESPSDGWFIYEVDTGLLHECGQGNKSDIEYIDGPLTIRTNCWFCGDIVYFYRADNGGMALFDNLGKPWPLHPCWNTYSKYRNSYLNKLNETLKKHSLSNRRGDYDFVSRGIGIEKPSTKIFLKSIDHHALDTATKGIVDLLNNYKVYPKETIPLKNRIEFIQGVRTKLYRRLISFEHNFDSRFTENQRMLVAAMEHLYIPKVVELVIKSDN
ncbi:hypothetical protein ACQUQP_02260 [Marinobacterium sp. YM272]|uniref:hypothetical protein n=1 Tax=Marinobacterium sp. YM272 TaxID=3421654 RepID=UPI003D7FFC12